MQEETGYETEIITDTGKINLTESENQVGITHEWIDINKTINKIERNSENDFG